MKRILSLLLTALLALSAAASAFAQGAGTNADYGGNGVDADYRGNVVDVDYGRAGVNALPLSAIAAASPAPFPDVPADAWYRDYVEDAKNRKIVEGYDDGYFRPLKTVTYGEFITMAVRHETCESDGRWDHWAYPHYLKAVQLGYFSESQISYRKLSKEIPRKDMALIVSGMLDAEGLSTKPPVASYSDVPKAHPYEYYVSNCSYAGVLEGYSDGSFKPEGYLKRSEAAKVFSVFAGIEEAAAGGKGQANGGGAAAAGADAPGNSEGGNADAGAGSRDKASGASEKMTMPPERRALLESVLSSINCYKENGTLYVAYDQPQIPDAYRMNLQFWVYGTEAENRSQLCWFCSDYSGADYQEKYDPSAHRTVRSVKNVSSVNGRLFRITLKVWDADSKYSYSSIQIDKERDGSVNLYYKNCEGESVSGEYLDCPKGMITW